MKAEPMLQDLEVVKERLAAQSGGDTLRFLDQMETWLDEHPHSGPVLASPEQLRARLRAREATEPPPPPPPGEPYRVHNPVIAEIHRIREQLAREPEAPGLVLKDEPPKAGG